MLGNGGPNHVAVVEALVKAGADTDIKDRQGATALTYARQRGYNDMIKILAPATRPANLTARGACLDPHCHGARFDRRR